MPKNPKEDPLNSQNAFSKSNFLKSEGSIILPKELFRKKIIFQKAVCSAEDLRLFWQCEILFRNSSFGEIILPALFKKFDFEKALKSCGNY